MNTTGKVLLAIGGIVLAGMVAYVLLPGHKAAPQDTDIADASKIEISGGASTQSASAPSTQPDPFATPTSAPTMGLTSNGQGQGNTDQKDPWNVLDQGGSRSAVGLGHSPSAALSGDADSNRTLPTPKTWKVATGDTLANISTKVYGSAKYASKIASANPRVNTRHLKTGQVLNLPEIAIHAPAVSSSDAPHSADASGASTLSGKTYKVVSGDSLRKISQKVFGNQANWEKIYELNKKLIGPDPAKLKQGMVLQLPEAANR